MLPISKFMYPNLRKKASLSLTSNENNISKAIIREVVHTFCQIGRVLISQLYFFLCKKITYFIKKNLQIILIV